MEQRLIDANELYARILSLHFSNREAYFAYSNMLDVICDMPTVDPVHGRNVSSLHPVDGFECSICGFAMEDYVEIVTVDDDNPPDKYYKEFEPRYCPNCGAKMDGDYGA